MKRETLNLWLQFHEDLHDAVPDEVVGFAKGWATAWVLYELPKYDLGEVDTDEFHHHNDWELNLVINPESLSVEVFAYPYIDEDEQADFSHFVRITEVRLDLNTDTNNKEK